MTNHVSRIHVITGGRYHNFDLARLTLLRIMAEDDAVRATCAGDFDDVGTLDDHVGVVLYTCDLMPTDEQAERLEAFVARGGRLFALHATNAPIDFTDGPAVEADGIRIPGLVKPPADDVAPVFMKLLGSRFRAHLAYQPFTVNVVNHHHEITRGLADFEIADEPYIATMLDDSAEVLLTARYKGDAPGYVLGHWPDDPPRPQLYVKRHGSGAVLYTTLGHACGRFDLRPMVEETAAVEGPWENPTFLEIVRRGVRWIAHPDPAALWADPSAARA
jgi:hypothetical protein